MYPPNPYVRTTIPNVKVLYKAISQVNGTLQNKEFPRDLGALLPQDLEDIEESMNQGLALTRYGMCWYHHLAFPKW